MLINAKPHKSNDLTTSVENLKKICYMCDRKKIGCKIANMWVYTCANPRVNYYYLTYINRNFRKKWLVVKKFNFCENVNNLWRNVNIFGATKKKTTQWCVKNNETKIINLRKFEKSDFWSRNSIFMKIITIISIKYERNDEWREVL